MASKETVEADSKYSLRDPTSTSNTDDEEDDYLYTTLLNPPKV